MEVDRIDAAVLAEELVEIYSTPTPKGWPELKKVIDLYLIDSCFLQQAITVYIYRVASLSSTRYRIAESIQSISAKSNMYES